jgi:hypothetical protein
MTRTFRLTLAAAPAAFLLACAESPAEPSGRVERLSPVDAPSRSVVLGSCTNLAAPAGSVELAHAWARGVQIYRWNGSAWAFVAPAADLFSDAAMTVRLGRHYAGPTWETTTGSKTVGAVADRCTPDPTTIPWLLLTATTNDRPGALQGTTHIQRVNTSGGKAPAEAGTVVGQERRVSYKAEYFFYRAP